MPGIVVSTNASDGKIDDYEEQLEDLSDEDDGVEGADEIAGMRHLDSLAS